MNYKFVYRLFLTMIFIFPCLLWACLDRSIWFWDPAMYGLEAIRAWRYLTLSSAGYFHNLFTMIGTKAPMICWVGQFFAPFGNIIGYEKAFLIMQVIFSAWMIIEVTRWKVFSSSYLTILIGALLVASTPDFIFQSHFYFVELSQAFGVLMTFGLYLRRKEVSVVYITCAYFALFFYLLGVKITSPFYIFFPSLALLHECWIRRKEYAWQAVTARATRIWFLLAIVMVVTVTTWYITNAMSIYTFAKAASSGKDALLYGQKAGLITKFKFWWPNVESLFWGGRTKVIFASLAILGFVLRWKLILDEAFCVAIAQIALILLAVCLQINQETRYIYPLLAYWVYVFGRVITRQSKWIMIIFLGLMLFRWVEMNLASLGVWPLKEWIPWSDTIDKKGAYLDQANLILKKTVDKAHPKGIVLGVELRQLNANVLQFKYFTQHHDAIENYPIYSIGYAQNSLDKAMQNIDHLQGEYLITIPPEQLKKLNDPWNQVSWKLVEKLRQSGWYTMASGPHYLILKKPGINHA